MMLYVHGYAGVKVGFGRCGNPKIKCSIGKKNDLIRNKLYNILPCESQ